MDLIDRYLAAIARRLPADKAADIVAEIRDDLLSRQEAREEALGRPLDQGEVSALIKETGHPLIVAARYRPPQYLIGPDAFPFFVATLRIVAMFLVVALAVGAAASVVFGHMPLVRAVMQSVTGLLSSAMLGFGTVVAIFYALEQAGFPADHLRRWRPEQLPEARDRQPGAWGPAFETAVSLYVILWWCGLVPLSLVYTNVTGLTLVPDPFWASLWWPLLALMVARLASNLVQRLRPRWKAMRGVLSVATAAGGIALLGVVYQAGHWLSARSAQMSPHKLIELDRVVNLGLRVAIVVVGAIWLVQCLREVWQLARAR
jgi:hypothetical protein